MTQQPMATATQDGKARPGPSIDVRYVANLARLDLTEEEIATFQTQLSQVVDYVNAISGLNVEGVEPTAHAAPVRNVFRDDAVTAGLAREQAIANAPEHSADLFKVPKIVE